MAGEEQTSIMDHPSAEQVVQAQLKAYNAHDLESFLKLFSDDICLHRLAGQGSDIAQPSIVGKASFREFYAMKRFNVPGLRADLLNRIVLSNIKVIDHERIFGVGAEPIDLAAIYEVHDGLIRRVW